MSNIFQKRPFNYGYQVGILNQVDYEVIPVTLTGVIADTLLQDLVIPGNVLVQDGQRLSLIAMGRKTLPIAGPTYIMRVNGITIFLDAFASHAGEQGWKMTSDLIRQGNDLVCVTDGRFLGVLVAPTNAAEQGSSSNFAKLINVDFSQPLAIAMSVALPGAGDSFTQEVSYVSVQ